MLKNKAKLVERDIVIYVHMQFMTLALDVERIRNEKDEHIIGLELP